MLLSIALVAAPLASLFPPAQLDGLRSVVVSHLVAAQQDKTAEYEKKRDEAGKDVAKLWDLYLWCDANGLDKQGRTTLRALLKEDDSHKAAHEALGHVEYDGQWFTSEKKLEEYKKAEEVRMAKEKGLVRYKDEWVLKEHLPFLEKGLTQDADGNWVNKEELEKIQGGWVKQDTVWVSPDEIPNIEKGLWKCDGSWKSLADANEFHSVIGRWWIIPTPTFTLYTTCKRENAIKILDHMDRAYRDMNRALGGSPDHPVNVAILNSKDQYGEFAAGSQEAQRSPTDARGLSSIHSGYFADTWFMNEDLEFMGAGVAYWDESDPDGAAYGVHAARLAAAMSLVEAIDPSPKAIASARKARLQGWDGSAFWEEKRLPEWYRNGLATYAERYFVDQFVAQGGNYNWARDWSIQNLMNKGGMRPTKNIFTDKLSFESAEDSNKLLNERGLVMAFILDGKCAPVSAAFGAAKNAVRTGDAKEVAKVMKELEKVILENEKALLQFAGL